MKNRCTKYKNLPSPLRLFFSVLIIVFVAEAAVMFLLSRLTYLEGPVEGLVDAIILAILISPFIWRFIVYPLRKAVEIEKVRAENIIMHAMDGIITINEQGIVESFNPAAEHIFGYESAEVIGQNVKMLMPEPDRSKHDTYIRNYLRTGIAKVTGIRREVVALRKDGRSFPLELNMNETPIDSRRLFVGIIRDITERKWAEEELIKLSSAVQQSSVSVVITDIKGNIEYMNPRFSQITGYTSEELIGKTASILKSGYHTQKFYQNLWETITSGKEWRGEFYNKKKNGETYWESGSISQIRNSEGKITHFLAVKEDITERKLAEKELIKSKKAAEVANQAKSEFLTNVSHEFRTPLNAIMGNTELILDTELNTEQLELLKTVESSSEALLNLINEILDYSKIEANQIELENKEFDFRKVVESVADIWRARADAKGLKLLCQVNSALHTSVIGDPARLHQILVNLVGNSIKFTNEGQVSIRVELLQHDSEVNDMDKQIGLHMMISDTGVGIPKIQQAMIFDKFTQADSSSTRNFGGTGLGLSISKSLVELMGGRIWLESEMGLGSTFHVELVLPVAKVQKTKHVEHSSPDLNKCSVLVVEDNEDNQNLAKKILEKAGCCVEVADNGQLAVEAVKQFHYDVILMDIQMPVMDGFEATTEIRILEQQFGEERKPIIALTAHALQGYREKCLKHDMDDYITKPIKKRNLLEILQKWIDPRPTILVVDDSPDNRNLILNYLRQSGAYKMVFAQNGQEAVEQVKKLTPSMILMDMEMPVMDGYKAATAIRKLENGQKIPIIALTAHQGKSERKKCFDAGCTDYLSKPIRKQQLLSTIGQYLKSPDADKSNRLVEIIDIGTVTENYQN